MSVPINDIVNSNELHLCYIKVVIHFDPNTLWLKWSFIVQMSNNMELIDRTIPANKEMLAKEVLVN